MRGAPTHTSPRFLGAHISWARYFRRFTRATIVSAIGEGEGSSIFSPAVANGQRRERRANQFIEQPCIAPHGGSSSTPPSRRATHSQIVNSKMTKTKALGIAGIGQLGAPLVQTGQARRSPTSCGDRRQRRSMNWNAHALPRVLRSPALSVQAEPSGRAATYEDFCNRSAVYLVGGRARLRQVHEHVGCGRVTLSINEVCEHETPNRHHDGTFHQLGSCRHVQLCLHGQWKYKIKPQEDCGKFGWIAEKDGASFDFCTATKGYADFEQNGRRIQSNLKR